MAFKDILIFLDPTPGSDERLKLAIRLAKEHGARLIGVDATADAAFQGQWRERALQVGADFEEMTRSAEVESRLVGADYREGGPSPDLSHCVDLVIAPRPEGEARELVQSFVPDEVLMKSGEPTLIVPQEWVLGPLGDSVVIAWNASREATRAVHDALPILQEGAQGGGVRLFAETERAARQRRRRSSNTSRATASRRSFPTGPTPARSRPSRRCSPVSTPRTATLLSPAASATRAFSRVFSAA